MKHKRLPDDTKSHARNLRHDATFPERLLWGKLRGGRLAGIKFRRQFPVEPFVVDFYCHEARLAIELDGNSHNDRGDDDRRRAAYISAKDIRILRICNDDVLKDLDSVLNAILLACGVAPDRPPQTQ